MRFNDPVFLEGGSGEAILLLHGITSGCAQMDPMAKAMCLDHQGRAGDPFQDPVGAQVLHKVGKLPKDPDGDLLVVDMIPAVQIHLAAHIPVEPDLLRGIGMTESITSF